MLSKVITYLFLYLPIHCMASISHGPLLGDLTDHEASIWFRTATPQNVDIQLINLKTSESKNFLVETDEIKDNSHIIRFTDLIENTNYRYEIKSQNGYVSGEFNTLGQSNQNKENKIVFGSCYYQEWLVNEKGRIFENMLEQKPDAVIFLGDFPYSELNVFDSE